MATITINLPDEHHQKLKDLAAYRGVSIDKLIEELSTVAFVEFDSENRFRIRQNRGSKERGLDLLDTLDEAYS
ncbi:MAG: toxin-antitoxin system HicB family antitoxin [Oscillatoria sp. PMC 1051.18]|nr:toxin-antitoxin system HicB family antitoxin [Oscillatoria sp. PMC 1050.18]MEC5030957.1 toxin-antitoxin system HicB family antitoxin [Oscillatoria sp. PMC 1051.18]